MKPEFKVPDITVTAMPLPEEVPLGALITDNDHSAFATVIRSILNDGTDPERGITAFDSAM